MSSTTPYGAAAAAANRFSPIQRRGKRSQTAGVSMAPNAILPARSVKERTTFGEIEKRARATTAHYLLDPNDHGQSNHDMGHPADHA